MTTSTVPGYYCWRAEYSGDTNYYGVTSTTIVNECFFVAPGQGCTPGFWGGGTGNVLRDQEDDAVVQALIAAFEALGLAESAARAVLNLPGSPHGADWYEVFGVPFAPLTPNPADNLPDTDSRCMARRRGAARREAAMAPGWPGLPPPPC